MLTKFAHILGPFLVFIGTLISDKPQIILAILLPDFISGGLVLTRVKQKAALATESGIRPLLD